MMWWDDLMRWYFFRVKMPLRLWWVGYRMPARVRRIRREMRAKGELPQ